MIHLRIGFMYGQIWASRLGEVRFHGFIAIWNWYEHLWWIRVNNSRLFSLKLINSNSSCYNIHPFLVKFLKWSSEVKYVECVPDTNSEILHLEIEPINIAFSIGVYFQKQVVFLTVKDVNWINISRFEVLIKCQDSWLLNGFRQFSVVLFLHIF